MVHLNEMYLLSFTIEIFAAMVTGVLLIGCLIERRFSTTADKLLVGVLIIHIATLLTDALSWYLQNPPALVGVNVLKLIYLINYALGYSMVAIYAYYLIAHISARCKVSLWYARGVSIGCIAAVILWIISMFNDMYIYFDENSMDHFGPMFWLCQALGVILPASTVVIAFRYRRVLGRRDTLVMMMYGLLPILSLPLQYFWYTTPLLLALTLSLVLVYTVVHIDETKRAAERKSLLAEKETELSELKISIMLSQIQPHFLYNALTTIKHLCAKNDPRAEQSVASFAKYLRGNMDSLTNKTPIPFEKELAHLENYLSIERLRFPQIEIIYDISVRDFVIPPLTVQTMVENSIRYGVTKKSDGVGTITVSSREDEKAYYAYIIDDGVGFDTTQILSDGRSHIGISNTAQRLEAMCGGSLAIESTIGKGTKVTITLPKERKNEGFLC